MKIMLYYIIILLYYYIVIMLNRHRSLNQFGYNRYFPKYYNVTMNREFTRRRRDKGTQVNKRPARTQASKYGLTRVGLLGLLIMGEAGEGSFVSKQNLFKIIHERKQRFQSNIHPFIYECLRRIQQLEPANDNFNIESLGSQYANLFVSSSLFYQMEKSTWITAQFLTPKSLRFTFHKELPREIRVLQNFTLKQLPLKIQDFQMFKGSPPIAVLNLGMRLIGMTVSTIRQQQKQVFNYQLSSKAQKYLIQKDSLFALLRNGNIAFGKIGEELDLLDAGKAKFQQLRLCGSDILVVTRSFIIKIITPSGNPKKIIRAGVEISNVLPIYISTNMYVLMAEQEGKACILNCYKQGKNNYLQVCPEGLQRIQQTVYLGKWILLRSCSNKIYAFALIRDKPVKIYEVYNGICAPMLKILHRKLAQS